MFPFFKGIVCCAATKISHYEIAYRNLKFEKKLLESLYSKFGTVFVRHFFSMGASGVTAWTLIV